MKKTLAFMIMAAALLLTQCKKPSITFPTPSETTTVSMTITAGPGSKTDISTMGGIVWSENDRIYVGDGSKYVGYLTIVSGVGNATGTFTGDVTVATGNDRTFHFYYLGSSDYAGSLASGTSTTIDVDFSSQNIYEDNNHKLKNASGQHVGYGKAEHVNVEADKPVMGLEVTMKSKVAIAYFCFQKGEGESANPYTDALTLSGEHIYNKMTVKFNASDFDFTPVKDGCISLANTTTHLKYAMLVPTGSTAEEILNFGGVVTGSTTLANGIEANKFYRVDGSMPIVVPLAHGMVNFGSPNLNWSVCNLGATNGSTAESWYGDYYAWGATETWYSAGGQTSSPTWKPGYSDGYSWAHCPFTNRIWSSGNKKVFTKYIPTDKPEYWAEDGNPDNKSVLESSDDAATANWGSGWRMPTEEEWNALYKRNTFEWLAANAKSTNVPSFTAVAAGYLVVKGKNATLDASVFMFLPAAGRRYGKVIHDAGSGYYWSSSLSTNHPDYAFNMSFNFDAVNPFDCIYRYVGCPVRPVRPAL